MENPPEHLAIQILIGLMHIGFGGISGAFFGHYTPISFIGGYPFWRGLSAATKGITVLLLLFTILEFSIAVSISYFACLAICYTPNTVRLSALKWGQSSDHVLNGGEDACLNKVPTLMAMLFRPYLANANLEVPSAQMASPEPPTNVD